MHNCTKPRHYLCFLHLTEILLPFDGTVYDEQQEESYVLDGLVYIAGKLLYEAPWRTYPACN